MPLRAILDNILDGVLCHCVLFQTTYWMVFYATMCYSRQHTGWCFMPLCAILDNILDGVLCHCVLFQTTYEMMFLYHSLGLEIIQLK